MEKAKIIDDFNDEDKVAESTFHDFKTEDTVIGILDRFEDTPNGKSLIINTNDGEITIGSYTALTHKFQTEDIGKKIKIVYAGEKKSKSGRIYMDFEVYKK